MGVRWFNVELRTQDKNKFHEKKPWHDAATDAESVRSDCDGSTTVRRWLRYMLCVFMWMLSVADLRQRPGARSPPPLRFKIFSISCSFSENLAKSYIGAPLQRVGPPSQGESWNRPWLCQTLFGFHHFRSLRTVCDRSVMLSLTYWGEKCQKSQNVLKQNIPFPQSLKNWNFSLKAQKLRSRFHPSPPPPHYCTMIGTSHGGICSVDWREETTAVSLEFT